MTPRFRNFLRAIAPRWLTEGEGGNVLTSLGLTMDAIVEHAREGVRARFPTYAPPDALGLMGRDRRITRGLSESDADYAVRLLQWLDDWKVAGNPYALMKQLRALIGVDMVMRTVDNAGNWYTRAADGTQSVNLAQGNWDWDGDADKWSRFWVILYPPSTLWTTIKWGSGLVWGQEGLTWGSTATPAQVKAVRAIVREWKPAGTRCVNIIVAFDPDSFDPVSGPTLPDGTWGQASKNDSGTQVTTRLATARYWKGTS